MKTEWNTVTVKDGTQMRLFVARPDLPSERAPGVIVLQEAFGVNAHIQDVTRRIAALGYVAVAPELFHRTAPGFEGDYTNFDSIRPHMNALTNETLEADLRATHEWLKADAKVDGERIAAVGFCMGGKAAFIANGILPLKAAASFYGGGIATILHAYVGTQAAPLLLIWGGKDKHVDVKQRAVVADALNENGKLFTQVDFSAADHGFFCDQRASYHADAAREAWVILVAFFKNHFEDDLP